MPFELNTGDIPKDELKEVVRGAAVFMGTAGIIQVEKLDLANDDIEIKAFGVDFTPSTDELGDVLADILRAVGQGIRIANGVESVDATQAESALLKTSFG